MSKTAIGKKIFRRPRCPFCGIPVPRPSDPVTRMPMEMPVGSCSCGAVYACDETGHSLGAAMLEALMYACGLDSDLAAGLLPEDDYLQEIVERYDFQSNLIVPGGALEGRRVRGALFFVRLHDDIQEVTRPLADGIMSRRAGRSSRSTSSKPDSSSVSTLTKAQVESLIERYDVALALKTALTDKKLVRNLQRLLYSGDPLPRKRAADVLGRVCAVIAEENPGAVSRLLQTLFTAVSDTAAFTWGAFEAIGEIIRSRPLVFGPYVSYLSPYLADETRLPQVVEALGRVAESSPELVKKLAFRMFHLLEHPDPVVRGNAVLILGFAGPAEAASEIRRFSGDESRLRIYDQGTIREVSVSDLAAEALERL